VAPRSVFLTSVTAPPEDPYSPMSWTPLLLDFYLVNISLLVVSRNCQRSSIRILYSVENFQVRHGRYSDFPIFPLIYSFCPLIPILPLVSSTFDLRSNIRMLPPLSFCLYRGISLGPFPLSIPSDTLHSGFEEVSKGQWEGIWFKLKRTWDVFLLLLGFLDPSSCVETFLRVPLFPFLFVLLN